MFEEREITYEINESSAKHVVNLLIQNRKNIIMDDEFYMIEKGKRTVELHFLASDGFAVTRQQDGSRKRLKFKLKKSGSCNISYDEKHFRDGKRFEENTKCSSFKEAHQKLQNMPSVDAILLKTAFRYDCVNRLNGNQMRFTVDCCIAFDPCNPQIVSKPFFYFEVEEKQGRLLEQFRESAVFRQLLQFLRPMTYKSHNRLWKCKTFFPESTLSVHSASELEALVSECFVYYNQNAQTIDEWLGNGGNYVRGTKEAERGDATEVELKFIPDDSHETVLSLIRPLLPPDWTLIKTAPRIILDVYMDTVALDLYERQATFRLRRRKRRDGWISCCKYRVESDGEFLARRKVRTSISNEQAMALLNGQVEGQSDAIQVIFDELLSHPQSLRPTILLTQCRQRYVVRPRAYDEAEVIADPEDEYYGMQRSDMIHIIFDTITATDVRHVNPLPLIHYDELDFTDIVDNSMSLTTAEMEANLRKDLKDSSWPLFESIAREIIQNGFKILDEDKYQMTVRLLHHVHES